MWARMAKDNRRTVGFSFSLRAVRSASSWPCSGSVPVESGGPRAVVMQEIDIQRGTAWPLPARKHVAYRHRTCIADRVSRSAGSGWR